MLRKKEVIAVQIVKNELVALKTENEAAISRDTFILQMSLDNLEYFIVIAGKEYLFKFNEKGEITEPSIDLLKQALQF